MGRNDRTVCVSLQVTSDSYGPVSSSVNGSAFQPFDMVIPFSFKKGAITGERRSRQERAAGTGPHVCQRPLCVSDFQVRC